MTEEGVIGGVGGSETVLLLLLLLLRYEGGGPRLSRRIGELPFPAGRIGGGRAVLVRADVVTKRSARGWLGTVAGERGERILLRSAHRPPRLTEMRRRTYILYSFKKYGCRSSVVRHSFLQVEV